MAARASIALVAAMVLWSSSFIALKYSFQAYNPHLVIFGRMLVGSLSFFILYCSNPKLFHFENYQTGDWKILLLMALCEPCLYFLFEAHAVVNTTASQAGVITAILPLLVMIVAALLLKEKMPKKVWTGALLAVLGVIWLTLSNAPSEDAPRPIFGNFLEFMAMICATGYTITMKKLTARYSPVFLTTVQAVIGAIFFFPLLFLPGTELVHHFDMRATLAILYLGAVITMGAYGLYNYALKYVPASRAAACVNLIPIFAVILGWGILGETLNEGQILAGIIILTGVYLTQR